MPDRIEAGIRHRGDGVSGAIVLGELAHTNAVMSTFLSASRCDNRHASHRIGPVPAGFVTCITRFSDEAPIAWGQLTLHWFRTASRHAELNNSNSFARTGGARQSCCVDHGDLSFAGSGCGPSAAAIARLGAAAGACGRTGIKPGFGWRRATGAAAHTGRNEAHRRSASRADS